MITKTKNNWRVICSELAQFFLHAMCWDKDVPMKMFFHLSRISIKITDIKEIDIYLFRFNEMFHVKHYR
ncbi:MAG: hypothetical protein CVU52_07240 [Deltaproteobacteria bacterium HGW-Deltaproteobacteria-10]|nr:MAG: hypothetical protein CVU62_04045 [Deltaproteobacteria bacterium HGW-Deltaproteobacteria-2]PKN73259.1 MAG: hypothetical protein CVU52_07240 [Deltaproteobacteria bacterium HGW-Deltaproteobacteria-10]